MKSVVMDIVVVDVPPKFEILLYRSWIKRLGGTLQMDLSYTAIPVFKGEQKILYREPNWPILSTTKKTPPTILSLNLILI